MPDIFAISDHDYIKPPQHLKRIKRKPPPVYDISGFLLDQSDSSSVLSRPSTAEQIEASGINSHLPEPFSSSISSHGSNQSLKTFERTSAKPVEAHYRLARRPQTVPVRPFAYPDGRHQARVPSFQLAGVGDLAVSPSTNLTSLARLPPKGIPVSNQHLFPADYTSVSKSCAPKQKVPSLLIPERSFIYPRYRRRQTSLLSSISSTLPTTPESSSESFSPFSMEDDSADSPHHDSSFDPCPQPSHSLLPVDSSVNTQSAPRPRKLQRRARFMKSSVKCSSESSDADSFDMFALPTKEQLEQAARLYVISEKGDKIRFGDLWRDQRTIVLFIRHFLCPQCQDYMYSIARTLPPGLLRDAGVKLVVVSNGSFGMIHSYAKIFRTPYSVYTDPKHQVYNAMGMTLQSLDPGMRGSYIRHGMLSGIGMVVMNAIKVGMPVWRNAGEMSQLGGEFCLGPGLRCSFAHRMRYTRDHMPIMDVVAQTGLSVYTSLHELSRSDQSLSSNWETEKEWAEERRRLLEELRRRKALRRGGSHWQSEDVVEDEWVVDYCNSEDRDVLGESTSNCDSFKDQ